MKQASNLPEVKSLKEEHDFLQKEVYKLRLEKQGWKRLKIELAIKAKKKGADFSAQKKSNFLRSLNFSALLIYS